MLLDLSHQAKETKVKNQKWGLVELKIFCTAKEITEIETQPTEWEKMFAF